MGVAKRGKKACPRCGKNLSVSEYYTYRRAHDGLTTYCKGCVNAASRKWHKENRDLHIARTRALRAAQPAGAGKLRSENMARLRAMPGNKKKCAVCIVKQHKLCTGRRRGSICECRCNRGRTTATAPLLKSA